MTSQERVEPWTLPHLDDERPWLLWVQPDTSAECWYCCVQHLGGREPFAVAMPPPETKCCICENIRPTREALKARIETLEKALREIVGCGVDPTDSRMSWFNLQVDKDEWPEWEKLAGVEHRSPDLPPAPRAALAKTEGEK